MAKFYSRTPNKHGGGAQTNENGLSYEGRTNLISALKLHTDISIVDDNKIFHCGIYKGYYTEKHQYYKLFLSPRLAIRNLRWQDLISKKYLPDSVIINEETKTVYIIEKKYQESSGSVDEKLQTCDFKKKIYSKLNNAVGYKTEYFYLLNTWYEQDQYDDVKEYIHSVDCKYFIDRIDLSEFGFFELNYLE